MKSLQLHQSKRKRETDLKYLNYRTNLKVFSRDHKRDDF